MCNSDGSTTEKVRARRGACHHPFSSAGWIMPLRPYLLIEGGGATTWNRDCLPIVLGQDASNQHDLANVVATVGQRTMNRQRHGVRFAPDGNDFQDILSRQ